MKTKRILKQYRRKEKTDYKKRLTLLKSSKPRLVVRISNKNISVQLIEYIAEGDKVSFVATSKELQKKGWKGSRKNEPAAYLIGYMLAKKASGKVKDAVLDIGKKRAVKYSRVYAAAKGAKDGGLHITISDEVLPDMKRIKGEHIAEYAKILSKDDNLKYKQLFSLYLKNNIKPEELPKHFEDVKANI